MSKEGCSGVTGEINFMYSTDMKHKFNKKERKKMLQNLNLAPICAS